jgi:suppressor for copper-sensitivity B
LGTNVGWGFQFQNIYFLTIITVVVLIFAMNLLGLFEILVPESFMRRMNSFVKDDTFVGNFFQELLQLYLPLLVQLLF